jgi:RNA polymerase-associated protein LEO1
MSKESIYIEYDLLNNFKNSETFETKFSNMAAVQTNCFDPETFQPEESYQIVNEKGIEETKEIPHSNYIRWRYSKNKQNEVKEKLIKGFNFKDDRKVESNAKIVEWSDGSLQLIIGEEYFDIKLSKMDNVRYGLKDMENELLIVNTPINHRMIITPSEYSNKNIERSKYNDSGSKVKLSYHYYDKQSYNKEEFKSKFPKKEKESNDGKKGLGSLLGKKRKTSN